jgi:thioredoxin reductase (NADPH)
MSNNYCDLAIIGSGLTGLSAAIAVYCKNPELKVKIYGIPFDSNTAKKGELENIPGINRIVGVDFIQQLVEQVQSLSLELTHDKITSEHQEGITKEEILSGVKSDLPVLDITNEMVKSVTKSEKGFNIVTDQQNIETKGIIISTGLPELKHTIKGEDEFVHKGVSHCAVCDGALFRGRKVAIIGTGNFVARGALFLRKYCRKITLLCPNKKLDCDKRFLKKLKASSNIKIKNNINLDSIEIFGNQTVEGLKYQEESEIKELSINAVFIELKDKPDLSILKELNIESTKEGFIKTQKDNSTNVKGLYAAGTVKGEFDYAPILMGDGYKTGIFVAEYLEENL